MADAFLFGLRNVGRLAGGVYNLGLDTANLSKEELALAVKRHVPNFGKAKFWIAMPKHLLTGFIPTKLYKNARLPAFIF